MRMSLNRSVNMALNVCHVTDSTWSSGQERQKVLAVSVSFRTATCKQSASSQCPILAEPSMLEKNSSSEMADSVPDHFGTKDTKDRSLWTVGGLCLIFPLSAEFPTALRSIRASNGPLG